MLRALSTRKQFTSLSVLAREASLKDGAAQAYIKDLRRILPASVQIETLMTNTKFVEGQPFYRLKVANG
jgi:hypothetical protein